MVQSGGLRGHWPAPAKSVRQPASTEATVGTDSPRRRRRPCLPPPAAAAARASPRRRRRCVPPDDHGNDVTDDVTAGRDGMTRRRPPQATRLVIARSRSHRSRPERHSSRSQPLRKLDALPTDWIAIGEATLLALAVRGDTRDQARRVSSPFGATHVTRLGELARRSGRHT